MNSQGERMQFTMRGDKDEGGDESGEGGVDT